MTTQVKECFKILEVLGYMFINGPVYMYIQSNELEQKNDTKVIPAYFIFKHIHLSV